MTGLSAASIWFIRHTGRGAVADTLWRALRLFLAQPGGVLWVRPFAFSHRVVGEVPATQLTQGNDSGPAGCRYSQSLEYFLVDGDGLSRSCAWRACSNLKKSKSCLEISALARRTSGGAAGRATARLRIDGVGVIRILEYVSNGRGPFEAT